MKYYIHQDYLDVLISEAELLRQYNALENEDGETFEDFVFNCQAENDGAIIEVTEAMRAKQG